MTLVQVPCAVCEARDFVAVHPGTILDRSADAARYFSSSRELAGYLPIVRCAQCGLVMQNPRDDQATLARVYAALADSTYDEEDTSRAASAREHLAFVEAYAPQPGRLLDVGCASGLFVEAARSRGWQADGADASVWAVERARERCPGARFEIGTLETLDFPPEAFAVITLFDVLEHVDAPHAALSRLRGWLRPGGLLCLSVPNAGSWTARLMGPRWVLLLREHLWYFSPQTLGQLLARAGYELVAVRTKWVSFSLHNVATRLAQYPGVLGRLSGRLVGNQALRRLPVRFPMGEMDVVARRLPG
jgi:2-polyprenyl-3-methyl-5-hydroxy-6-metoxy-1,4-benzoquinol methylase